MQQQFPIHLHIGYVEVITYDKEAERENKRKIAIRYEDIIDEDDDYKNIFRTEVRIKNKKLNYYKLNHNWALAKDLCNYLTTDMKAYFFKKYAEKVWFAENFYRIDVALEKIKQDVNLSSKMKKKLCEVIKKINKYGYSKAEKYYGTVKRKNQIEKAFSQGKSNDYIKGLKQKALNSSDYVTFSTYIKHIRELGINPLTFDKDFTLEKLPNFARYEGED